MKCYDCLYKPHCSYWDSKDFEPDERLCFSDRSEWMKLPRSPIPLMEDKNPFNTDVYCPTCGENLSGYYGEEPLAVVQCYSCGEIIDTTKLQVGCDDKTH